MKSWVFSAVALAVLCTASGLARAEAEGAKRALLVGCSEYPRLRKEFGEKKYRAEVQLFGPGRDVVLLRRVLADVLGYPEEGMTVLTGWDEDESSRPTRKNILSHLDRLAAAVKKGDRVAILLAGHGTQQPDESDDEPDKLDEVFLPADAGSWKREIGSVENGISDDEIGARVKAIRDAGAVVWIIFDCCNSGTMVRGDAAGVRERRLDPDVLGIPRPPMARGVATQGSGMDLEGDDLDDIVALSASQSFQAAQEMPLPKGQEGAEYHGVLSYLIAAQLRQRGGGITFRELRDQLVKGYGALPCYGPTPHAEGELRLTVGGRESVGGPLLFVWAAEGALKADAGTLADVYPGTVLEVFPPGKPGVEDARLGYARVTSSRTHESVLEPVERDGLKLPSLEGELHPARVVERPFGDHGLKLACCDRDGRVLAKVPGAVLKALEESGEPWKFPFVDSPSKADWLLLVDGGGLALCPVLAGEGENWTIPIDDGDALVATLDNIYRYENLKRLAAKSRPADREEIPTVELIKIVKGKKSPLESGDVLHPEDKVRFSIQNGTGRDFELWIFFLDARYGIHRFHPRGPGGATASPVLAAKDREKKPLFEATVKGWSLGMEHLLIIAIPHQKDVPPANLEFLAQEPQTIILSETRGGAAPGGELRALLQELASGQTRGAKLVVGGGADAVLRLVSWRTAR